MPLGYDVFFSSIGESHEHVTIFFRLEVASPGSGQRIYCRGLQYETHLFQRQNENITWAWTVNLIFINKTEKNV